MENLQTLTKKQLIDKIENQRLNNRGRWEIEIKRISDFRFFKQIELHDKFTIIINSPQYTEVAIYITTKELVDLLKTYKDNLNNR
ncbi:hypothetical protein [Flavobacterium limi]|uniref:Phage protein n=1 Tax=Flavobacterium limi TaxID=2045105 RepID=A0ABQ1TM67_9FLAO|nr:hypothetical protein [Flavobacterium limi]GGE98285.1 hypothetical protein GCM10011518_04650 [Flavobacterium limi]